MSSRISSLITSRREAIERTLEGLKLLPSSAAVAMKVMDLKRRDGAGAADTARVIAADAALAAKILALANSAAFAPVIPVTRLSIAIAKIGLNNLLPLVFGLSIAGIFNKLTLPADIQAQLWRASLLKAVTARCCVRRIGGPFVNAPAREAAAEEAFLAALFQDIALPVFSAGDRSMWPEFLNVLDVSDEERPEREAALYGVDHTEIGATVARMLGLPQVFIAATGAHHAGVRALTAVGAGPIAIALDVAASLPHRLPSFSAKCLSTLVVRLRFTAESSTTDLADLAREIADDFTKTSALFDKPEDATASYKQFLQNLGAEVAESLQSSMIRSATEIGGLKDRQRRLGDAVMALKDQTERAEFDPLTKVLTRAAFMARFEKLPPMARRHGASCAVGFLDVDNFKDINDTHGHAAGDAALAATATLLAAAVKDTGIVGRMGGDEFVFAFAVRPEALDSTTAAILGSMVRVSFIHDGNALNLTTSIGIHSLGVPEADADSQRALRAADELMYEAKRSGKGRGNVGKRPAAMDTVNPLLPAAAANGIADSTAA